METEDEWRTPRKVGEFRGSEVGYCPRQIQYTLQGYKPEAISPELALLFRDGHLHHSDVRSLLQRIGRLTNIEFPHRKDYQVSVREELQKFTITTTTDGIYNGEYVVEVKGINRFSFGALKSEADVKRLYQKYVDQLQQYMDTYELEWGMLLFKNKDTSELKLFWFQRDREAHAEILQRLAKVNYLIGKGKMHKRPYAKNSKECKYCPMFTHCWK